MIELFLLLVIFQLKHFVADFPLQNEYMLGKFKKDGWVPPLLLHSGVHAVCSFLIALCFTGSVVRSTLLGLFDLVIHFGMDRVKASPDLLGKFKSLTTNEYRGAKLRASGKNMISGDSLDPQEFSDGVLDAYKKAGIKDLKSNKYFWWALGLDQMVHHLTHYVIIYFILGA